MSNFKNFLKFKISGARPEDAFEIMEEVDDDVPSDEEEGEIVELGDDEDIGDPNDDVDNEEEKEEEEEEEEKNVTEKEVLGQKNPKIDEVSPKDLPSSPKIAPKSFFKVTKLTRVPKNLLIKIMSYLTIKDITSTALQISKVFNKISLTNMELVENKMFLESEYSDFLDIKRGLSRTMIIKVLKFKNLNVKHVQNETETFFTYSCRKKYFKAAKFMITKMSDVVDITQFENIAMKILSKNGAYLIIKEMLRDKRINSNLNLLWNCFNISVQNKKLECLKVLINRVKEIDISKDEFSCVMLAIKSSAYDVFKYLYEHSKKMNKKMSKKVTEDFVMAMVTLGRPNMLKLVIKDSRFDITRENDLPLRMACSLGKKDVVKVLLKDKRVDPSSNGSNEALLWSAEQGFFEIVKMLLKTKKVDPTVCEKYAYRQAISKGFKRIAGILEKAIRKIEQKREKQYRKELAPIRKRLEAENKRYLEERRKIKEMMKRKKAELNDPSHDNFLDSVFGDDNDEVKPVEESDKIDEGEIKVEEKEKEKKNNEKKKEENKTKPSENKVKPMELPSDKDFDVNI